MARLEQYLLLGSILLGLLGAVPVGAGTIPLRKLKPADQERRIEGDLKAAQIYRQGLLNAASFAWFPVQAGVAEWMGDTKVHRVGRSLIRPEQIQSLRPRLVPGDVMLTRREWYLSNVGLPGYWPHAALFIGTPAGRRRLLADPEVASWVRAEGVASGDLEELLERRSPRAYTESLRLQEGHHATRVLEAMSEGVVFTTLEHSADADAVAVLRPLVPAREKAEAIVRAFQFAGRPYDFNFDFATDSAIVCTEMVYKAYEPAQGSRGLALPLVSLLGRQVLPANEIARQFDAQTGAGAAQFAWVAFLDGQEREGKAVEASLADFRQSWRRPKRHILTQVQK